MTTVCFQSHRWTTELQAYVAQAVCVDRHYPLLASQKSVSAGFSANSLAQTFAQLYSAAGLGGISTNAAYLYSSPNQLQAAVNLL